MPSTSSVFPRKISSTLSFNSEEAQSVDMQMSDQLTTLSFSPSTRIRSRKSDKFNYFSGF